MLGLKLWPSYLGTISSLCFPFLPLWGLTPPALKWKMGALSTQQQTAVQGPVLSRLFLNDPRTRDHFFPFLVVEGKKYWSLIEMEGNSDFSTYTQDPALGCSPTLLFMYCLWLPFSGMQLSPCVRDQVAFVQTRYKYLIGCQPSLGAELDT